MSSAEQRQYYLGKYYGGGRAGLGTGYCCCKAVVLTELSKFRDNVHVVIGQTQVAINTSRLNAN